jgi:hypothetical protein
MGMVDHLQGMGMVDHLQGMGMVDHLQGMGMVDHLQGMGMVDHLGMDLVHLLCMAHLDTHNLEVHLPQAILTSLDLDQNIPAWPVTQPMKEDLYPQIIRLSAILMKIKEGRFIAHLVII